MIQLPWSQICSPSFYVLHSNVAGAEEEAFDYLEDEMDMEIEVSAVPPCNDPKVAADPRLNQCTKPADLSRGAGFAETNQGACTAASKGLGCELVKDKALYFPKCSPAHHAVGSLCSWNCPMGMMDLPTLCQREKGK